VKAIPKFIDDKKKERLSSINRALILNSFETLSAARGFAKFWVEKFEELDEKDQHRYFWHYKVFFNLQATLVKFKTESEYSAARDLEIGVELERYHNWEQVDYLKEGVKESCTCGKLIAVRYSEVEIK
jgi:hypothetical protein